jgi:hypothetical protein
MSKTPKCTENLMFNILVPVDSLKFSIFFLKSNLILTFKCPVGSFL